MWSESATIHKPAQSFPPRKDGVDAFPGLWSLSSPLIPSNGDRDIMKRFWSTFSPLALVLAACWSLPSPRLLAQDPPQKIDVSKFNSRVDDVVIPVPSEIFNALDKLGGNPNWKGEIAPISKAHYSQPAQLGLLLGAVIANGFIAVQAKDADKVKEVGRRVLELSKALSVEDEVKSHCNSINEAAGDGKWEAIRSELDKTQSSVRAAMEHIRSKEVAELISVGGWMRGTDALTSLIRKSYSADKAELLHQPELVSTFNNQLDHLKDARIKSNPMVIKVQEALKAIQPMIDSSDLDQKSVEKINTVTGDLLKTISP